MAVTTADVLRKSAGASIGYGLLFGFGLPFFCLLGVPTTLILLALIGRQLDGVSSGGARERDARWRGGLFIFLFVAVVIFASVAGVTAASRLLPTVADDLQHLLGVVVALGLALAIVLPYAFVPLILRDGAIPAGVGGHAFVLSAQAVTRLPVRRRVGLVAGTLLAHVVPYGLFTFLEGPHTLLSAAGAIVLAYAVLVPVATAHYVAAYASVRDGLDHEPLEEEPAAVPASLRAAGISAALSAAVLLFLMAEAVLAPLPMAPSEGDTELLEPVPGAEPLSIGDGVLVRSAGEGVTVAARDGGGVGFVSSGCGPVDRVAVTPRPGGAYTITAYCPDGLSEMLVDGRGVRQDDSFEDRFEVRTSGFFLALAGLSLALWMVAFGGPWRAFQRVRYLHSLARTDDLEAAPGLRALEGTLHAEGGLRVAEGRFRCEGSAQVSGGPLRVSLPDEGPALGSEEATLHDGSTVAVVGHFERLVSDGLRAGPAPWPEDGLLVPGGRREAADRLARSAGRRLALLLGAVTAAQGVAAIVLVLGW